MNGMSAAYPAADASNGDCGWLGHLPERLEIELPVRSSMERATVSVVKLVRAFGGCLGTKRR